MCELCDERKLTEQVQTQTSTIPIGVLMKMTSPWMSIKLELGKSYMSVSGVRYDVIFETGKQFLVKVHGSESSVCLYDETGYPLFGCNTWPTLVKEYKEKTVFKGYINLYKDRIGSLVYVDRVFAVEKGKNNDNYIQTIEIVHEVEE